MSDEKAKAEYATEKVFKAIERLHFETSFGILAGILCGLSATQGMTLEEMVAKIGHLTVHDSPDGRTSEQLIEAFRKGKAS